MSCQIKSCQSYQIKHCGVLLTPEISDQDAVYACISSRKFKQRFKLIRDMKNFDIQSYSNDVALPFYTVYATDSLDSLKKMLLSYIERHTFLKKIEYWMNDLTIEGFQKDCRDKRF